MEQWGVVGLQADKEYSVLITEWAYKGIWKQKVSYICNQIIEGDSCYKLLDEITSLLLYIFCLLL